MRSAFFILMTALVSGVLANHALAQNNRHDLFQKINYIGAVDPRQELRNIDELKKMGFGPSEIERVRNCSGIVICPKTDAEKRTWDSATSVESNQQIITAVHVFFNDVNSSQPTPKKNISSCQFLNYANPHHRIPLVFNSAERQDAESRDINHDNRQEGIRVRLKYPIPECRHPFEVDRSNQQLRVGERVISVAHASSEMYPRVSGKEPTGQVCEITRVKMSDSPPTVYNSNCSANRGQSGGIQLIKRDVLVDGQVKSKWLVKAITIMTGARWLDGRAYNEATGSYTELVGVEGRFLHAILEGASETSLSKKSH